MNRKIFTDDGRPQLNNVGKKRTNDETQYQQMFQSRMKKIKSRRKHFRQMLFDAFDERKKLIESMGLQKREEEVLRRKVPLLSGSYVCVCAFLRAVPDG